MSGIKYHKDIKYYMPTTIAFTKILGQQKRVIPRNNGITDNITIDNDEYNDAHDFLIDKRNIEKLLMQIQNTGDTNSMSFEIFGTVSPSDPPPAFDVTEWHLLNSGVGSIVKLESELFDSNDPLTWICIRLKRYESNNDTTAKITATSGVFA